MRKKIPELAEKYLKSEGYTSLYPPQKACVQAGLLDGKSLLVSAPTASGKTLIAILAIISHISKRGGKVIYLSPLRALAAEKFAEFKKLEKLDFGRNIRVSVSTGDFDGRDRNLAKSDILILTNEKMDSIIRHRAEWVDEIGLVIADEVHLIGDETRGPTLEMVLTQLKTSVNDLQIVGLSATVTNSDIISDWLGCKLIKTDWRPVPLFEGVTDGNHIIMNNNDTFEFKKTKNGTPIDLGVQSVAEGGQSLIFAETRARSKSLATKAASVVYDLLENKELDKLAKISAKVLRENEQTDMVKTLATLLKSGVAFHHAGLNQNCRSVVEEEFKKGTIKILSSTPTLAAGVNLPARRVVISRVTRYDAREGRNMPISVMEYKQLCGRAGRPQFDKYGQAIVVGNDNAEDVIERYIDGTPEPIISKITDDRSLRTHILSVIVTHPGIKKDDLLGFFLQTLGGVQSSKANVKFAISISLRFLTSQDMVVAKGDRYAATEFGQKTSMLY
ncbi:MAG: DEAD/DEAH box helicase, partial [Thaumarchaeota archaeon]|nr:DEAD/DEAH box helicase [Nitrososphaerota archaeon]